MSKENTGVVGTGTGAGESKIKKPHMSKAAAQKAVEEEAAAAAEVEKKAAAQKSADEKKATASAAKKAEAEKKKQEQEAAESKKAEEEKAAREAEEKATAEEAARIAEETARAGAEAATKGQESGAENPESLTDEQFDKGQRDGIIEDKGDKGGESVGDGQVALEDDGSTNVTQPPSTDEENLEPFKRKTRLDKSSRDISVRKLYNDWVKDQQFRARRNAKIEEAEKAGEPIPDIKNEATLRFDLAIQRNETWSDIQKSDLIHSILYGYYIPPILAEDSNDGKIWFLDGKQRLTSLLSFIEGSWKLSKKTKTVYGYKIAGMRFKDLPMEMQEEILNEQLTLVRIKNMTVAERDEMFVKQNSGSPLSRIEMIRAMHSELIEVIDEIAKLKFFKDEIEISKKARSGYVDQEIILQIAMLFEDGRDKLKGLAAQHIEEYVLRLKNEGRTISKEMVENFEDISAYLSLATEDFDLETAQKALKKIHIPIMFVVAQKAMQNDLQPTLYGDFLKSFLVTNYSVETLYGQTCQSSTPKRESVITRLDELSKELDVFMGTISSAESLEEGVRAFDKYLGEKNNIEKQLDIDDAKEEQTA